MFTKVTIDAIKKVAEQYGYETEALLAITDVESAGVPFWNVNGEAKPAIRFEGHYFYDRLQGAFLDQAIKEGLASPKAGAVKNPSKYEDRYTLLARAVKLDKNAAYESVSWGLGQVMGANWKSLGYASVDALVSSAQTLTGQIELMVRFIEANDLKKYVDSHNWAAFARGYNGKSYKKNAYDTKMAEAYAKYKEGIDSADEAEISQLQSMLNKINVEYKLDVDGVLGKETKAALRDFQLKNGLKVDGIYGPLTKEKLQEIYLAQSNKGTQNVGVGGSAIGTAGLAVTEAAKAIQPFTGASQIIQYVFIGVLILGVLITLKSIFWPKKVV